MNSDLSAKYMNPPCVSWKTFFNFLLSLADKIPARIDRSCWSQLLSGSNGKAVVNAMRFLDLIDNTDAPTDKLKLFLKANASERINIMNKILTNSYDAAFNKKFSLVNATQSQLYEYFKSTCGLSKEDSDKCMKFIAGGSTYSYITMASGADKNHKKKTAVKSIRNADSEADKTTENLSEIQEKSVRSAKPLERSLVEKLPEFRDEWPYEMKMAWFKLSQSIVDSVLK